MMMPLPFYQGTNSRRSFTRILQFSIISIVIVGCAKIDTDYRQILVNNIQVCDLDILDTSKVLGLNLQSGEITASQVLSVFLMDQVEWKTSDINISRCSPKKSPDLLNVLRVHIPKERWSNGFQYTYDLYFEGEQLVAIESRHRFIDL